MLRVLFEYSYQYEYEYLSTVVQLYSTAVDSQYGLYRYPVHRRVFYSCPGKRYIMYVAFFSLGYTVKVAGSRVRSEDVGKTECILQGSHQF